MRLRSDEQLVASFRDGNNEAFRVIHDRYRPRLFAYTRQMLPGSRQDAEDALQDVFVRAFGGLRANDRELALRAWLYRIAHNRCIDELRRPAPPGPEVMELVRPPQTDPIAEAEQRESLRRLVSDVRRLPEQQRSALLMRELAGMSYVEISEALMISTPAVKSLLVRARVGLAQAAEARDTACGEIRAGLVLAYDRGVRPTGMARRHLRDCVGCREFRGELRTHSRQFAALAPTLGPAGFLAKLLGVGGGAGGGAGAAAGAAGGGGAVSAGGAIGVSHVATIFAAAVVAAGGAVEIQHSITLRPHRVTHRPAVVSKAIPAVPAQKSRSYVYAGPAPSAPKPTVAAPTAVTEPPVAPVVAPSRSVVDPDPTVVTKDRPVSLGGFTGMEPADVAAESSTGASGTGAASGATGSGDTGTSTSSSSTSSSTGGSAGDTGSSTGGSTGTGTGSGSGSTSSTGSTSSSGGSSTGSGGSSSSAGSSTG